MTTAAAHGFSDAATYERVSGPQAEWAATVLDRLPLEGHETVLDAGCGSGRVTRMLLERLPRGHVIAVDVSEPMVAAAGETSDRITAIRADLADLELGDPVDHAFSNAAFHWVSDHDALFRALRDALRPGGRLAAQCGGEGNVERFHAHVLEVSERDPYATSLAGWEGPWNFASAETTRSRLGAAGFEQVRCWSEPWPVTPEEPEAFLRSVCLGPHLDRLPAALRGRFVEDVLVRTGQRPELDYVRLNIEARRPL